MHPSFKYLAGGLALGATFALSTQALAAVQHYVPGVEGSLAASVPPAGFYLRTYGVRYQSDNVKVDSPANNGEVPGGDDEANVTAVVPRAIWISKHDFLGADYGAELITPLVDKKVTVGTTESDRGLGDVYIGPAILAWHGSQYDAVFAAGYWTDAFSNYDDANPVAAAASAGQGYSNVMFTLGGTWYPTADRTWAVSLLNRYETMASKIEGSDIEPGDNWVAEWGVSRNFGPAWTVGLVGYESWQVTEDHGPGASSLKDEVHAAGGQVTYRSRSLGMSFDAALYDEYYSKYRPEGTTARVTVTIPF